MNRLAWVALVLAACHPTQDGLHVDGATARAASAPSREPGRPPDADSASSATLTDAATAEGEGGARNEQEFTMDPTRNYVTMWAHGSRSSHIDVSMRRAESIERVAELGAPSTPGPDASRTLVLASPAVVVVVRYADYWVFDRARMAWRASGIAEGEGAYLTPSGVIFRYYESDYDGRLTGRTVTNPGLPQPGRLWAQDVRQNLVRLVLLETQPTPRYRPPSLSIVIDRFNPGIAKAETIGGTDVEDVLAASAVFENDGAVASVTTKGRAMVFPPAPPPGLFDTPAVVDRHVPVSAYDVSVSRDQIAVLEAVGSVPYSTREELAWMWRGFEERPRWSTRLHVLDRRANLMSSATVPFPVLQPPIDGEGGRFYLAGLGFAAVEGSKPVYWHQSKTQCFATALRGGDVLVAEGPELRFVKRDGTIRQTFKVPDGEEIRAAPAVAEDGTVWVTTAQALYAVH